MALLVLVTNLLKVVPLGGAAQLLGLVTFQLSYPVIICRGRLLLIGREYEEAAMDLGALPVRALRHVLLPLLAPAIFTSAVLVFADVIDDFVLVRYLSSDAATEPMSVKIYNSAAPAPPRRSTRSPASCWRRRCWPWPSARSSTAASPAASAAASPPSRTWPRRCEGGAPTGSAGQCRLGSVLQAPRRQREPAQRLEVRRQPGRALLQPVRPGGQQPPALPQVAGERVLAGVGVPRGGGQAAGVVAHVRQRQRRLGRRVAVAPQPVARVEPVVAQQPVAVGGDQVDRLDEVVADGVGAEVLALVAAGRSNRQIAQALFISPKTASVHVSNILAKLGVATRVEAAAVAHRFGLDRD